jgi:decaprenyl-phosphate phosphoribosyltransferase
MTTYSVDPSSDVSDQDPMPPDRPPLGPPMLRALRPRQWVKNLLVIAAPLAAGTLDESDVVVRTALAFATFCLVASAVYLVNDVIDAEGDRRHPSKRRRPVAAGEIAPATAIATAAFLLCGGLVLGYAVAWQLGLTITVYVAIQAAYSLGLKDQPVMDLAAVASGFLLRAIAGGVASSIYLSPWFLLVAAFGSLFMVAGKRYSEIHAIGAYAGTRRSLEYYSESYLRFVWGLAASVAVVAYSLWAFDQAVEGDGFAWEEISVAPFVLGMLRYAVDIDRGAAGAPEDIVFGDRVLQVLGVAWIAAVCLGVWQR